MKYQNNSAFYNHLKQSIPTGLASVFLIVSSCGYERRKIAEKILTTLKTVKERIEFLSDTASDVSVQTVIEDLNTFSITSSTKVVYLDGVEKMKKGDLALLASYVEHPSPSSYLILSAESGKGLSELYAKGKKELIACDLSEEKPWELKGRLKGFLEERVASFSKQIDPEALELLLERVGLFLPNLEKEIDRLLCYIGERKKICVPDVKILVVEQKEVYLFHLLDQILWGSSYQEVRDEAASDLLFPLLSQMKVQLQQSLALTLLLERRIPTQELSFHFPQVKPYHLEKLLSKVRGKSPLFFRKALDLTFEMELLAKTGNQDPPLILDLLLAKMKLLRHPVS